MCAASCESNKLLLTLPDAAGKAKVRNQCKECKWGLAQENGLCGACGDTWHTISYEGLRADTNYMGRTLFIGNLQFDKYDEHRPQDLVSLVHGKFPEGEGKPAIINARARKGGLRGRHGYYRKVFKTFAHIKFQQVQHARRALDLLHESEDHGRRLKAYPAVVQGSYL